ncbi:methylglyoxal synthase [Synechococcus sp. CC9616]|uniref:methylglyoxal synthase n=1 Tax=Synechococcus sp. CC9616 TaxID=110663 RepID=UPI0004BA1AB9|nr:methylglyoxal synthase [Synechococcus sp. CC9616]
MGTDELTEFLMANSVLPENFSKEEIAAFAEQLNVEEYPAGETLMREGTPACSLMLLISGEVRRMLGDVELDLLHAGEFIGKSMLTDEGSHYANVVATEPVVVGHLTIEHYGLLVEAAPVASRKFKQYFSDIHIQEMHEKQGLSFVDQRSYLGLVAHNEMKESLMLFARTHAEKLKRFHLVATGTTGIKLYQEVGLMISKKLASGPLGGDQAIGKMISENNIKGLIFFRDPLSPHPHHADIEALGRLCDVYQVPMATNPGGAAALLNFLLIDHPEEPAIPNRVLEKYRNAQKKVVAQPAQ